MWFFNMLTFIRLENFVQALPIMFLAFVRLPPLLRFQIFFCLSPRVVALVRIVYRSTGPESRCHDQQWMLFVLSAMLARRMNDCLQFFWSRKDARAAMTSSSQSELRDMGALSAVNDWLLSWLSGVKPYVIDKRRFS